MASTDDLWGGTLTSLTFDPTIWTVRCEVTVADPAARRRFELRVEGVSAVRAEREVPLPWNYAELTEVHVTEKGHGVQLDLVLWSDDTAVSVLGSRVEVVAIG